MGKVIKLELKESVWLGLQAALKQAGLMTSDAEPGSVDEEGPSRRVREARLRRGWSRERLAQEAGVGLNTVARLEEEEREPREETLQKIALALRKDPVWLMSGKGAEERTEAC